MYKGEDRVLELLSRRKELALEDISKETGLNEDTVRRIVESLKGSGHATVSTSESQRVVVLPEFEQYVKSGFPEESVFRKALRNAPLSQLSQEEKAIGIRWAKVKGFVSIEGTNLQASKEESEVSAALEEIRKAYSEIKANGTCDSVLLDELLRRHLVEKKSVRLSLVRYTGKVLEKVAAFDVTIPAENAYVGKSHPITKITKRMKEIMVELGFEEMDGGIVESSFWNFDALFQPQDHPARELADTFYLKGKAELPDRKLVQRVKAAHEKGWKYEWNPEEASRLVLRTHTTCLSARYLADMKDKKPSKYFAIGRVFRNEATDYKHLAEFHQVEGIIAWENAKFTDLLGILKEFYRKLGFEKIRFRPSFFPYTEPSLEIEVYYEPRKQWLELGGAGMFRPEVSLPLAGVYPVLAWGLSLERPLMLLLDLDDIRTFYRNDADFLKSARLKI